MKRRMSALLLALCMGLSMTACGQKNAETTAAPTESAATEATTEAPAAEPAAGYTAGTYTGTVKGMNGDVVVEVTFDEKGMTDIVVKEQAETFGIGQGLDTTPIETLPGKMLAGQTVNVDFVTGATISSAALKMAVSDCVAQVGGDAASMPAYQEATEYAETVDADVVVVGAGAAGLAASITAAENGAKVVLVEKQGVTGGSTTRSGGKILAAGTDWQTKQGFEDNADMMFDYLMEFSKGLINEELLRPFCDDSAENLKWLEDLGVKVQDVEPIHSSLTPWRVHNTLGGGGQTSGHGGQITVPMTLKAQELGVEILYNVSGKELITDAEGTVIGVKAEAADGTAITLNSKAVVLATGGYASSPEMMARYADFLPKESVYQCTQRQCGRWTDHGYCRRCKTV